MLHKLDLSRRLVKWAIELSMYAPATIKGQSVADFLVELTHTNLVVPWVVEVDGSSYSTGSGIGIKNYEHSFRLLFPATNNVVEYKADLHGLKMLCGLGGDQCHPTHQFPVSCLPSVQKICG